MNLAFCNLLTTIHKYYINHSSYKPLQIAFSITILLHKWQQSPAPTSKFYHDSMTRLHYLDIDVCSLHNTFHAITADHRMCHHSVIFSGILLAKWSYEGTKTFIIRNVIRSRDSLHWCPYWKTHEILLPLICTFWCRLCLSCSKAFCILPVSNIVLWIQSCWCSLNAVITATLARLDAGGH